MYAMGLIDPIIFLPLQAIAEKSVNCSLLTLPRSRSSRLPICGPLEGLALTYILREQSTLLSGDARLRDTFQDRLSDACPNRRCYEEVFEHRIVRVSSSMAGKGAGGQEDRDEQDFRSRNRGREGQTVRRSRTAAASSTVQLTYWSEEFIPVRRYQSGSLAMVQTVGALCGICSVVVLVVVSLRRGCSRGRGGMLFNQSAWQKHRTL